MANSCSSSRLICQSVPHSGLHLKSPGQAPIFPQQVQNGDIGLVKHGILIPFKLKVAGGDGLLDAMTFLPVVR